MRSLLKIEDLSLLELEYYFLIIYRRRVYLRDKFLFELS